MRGRAPRTYARDYTTISEVPIGFGGLGQRWLIDSIGASLLAIRNSYSLAWRG